VDIKTHCICVTATVIFLHKIKNGSFLNILQNAAVRTSVSRSPHCYDWKLEYCAVVLRVFLCDVRCCDLAKNFEGVSTHVKMVADCGTVENAADSAVNLISEHLLKVRLCRLFHVFGNILYLSLAVWLVCS